MVNFVDVLTRLDKVQTSLTLCSLLQKFEKKGLCDQLQRAAVSICSNIAEGSAKPSNAEYAHYLDMALGSAYEVETQLLIANKVGYIKNEDEDGNANYEELHRGIVDIEKQLAGLIRTLRER